MPGTVRSVTGPGARGRLGERTTTPAPAKSGARPSQAQAHRFGDAEAVPVHHEHEQVIARAVPAPLRRAEDAVDLVLGPPNLDLAELASGKTLMGNLTKG